MKNFAFALIAGAALLTISPVLAEGAGTSAYRYSTAYTNGWPKWIGRLDDRMYRDSLRPEMAAKYLPLSLIRTGGFEKLVKEVMETPNVDTTQWPGWIGEVGSVRP